MCPGVSAHCAAPATFRVHLSEQSCPMYDTPTFTGSMVVLRAVQPEDEQARQKLGWNAQIEHGYGRVFPTRDMTAAEAKSWYDARQQELAASSLRRSWMITASSALVGTAMLTVQQC